MRFSLALCAGAFALLASATTAEVAVGATALTKTSYKLNPADANAAKACTDAGGTVTSVGGGQVCTLPAGCAIKATSSYKLDPLDQGAAKACTDACGAVSTDTSGAKVCTMTAASVTPNASSTTTREPHN